MSERSTLASISEKLLTAQFPLRKGVFHFSPKPLEARAGLRSAPHRIGGVREADVQDRSPAQRSKARRKRRQKRHQWRPGWRPSIRCSLSWALVKKSRAGGIATPRRRADQRRAYFQLSMCSGGSCTQISKGFESFYGVVGFSTGVRVTCSL